MIIWSNLNSCDVRHDDSIQKQLFDLNWKFNRGNYVFATELEMNDKSWRDLDLPHNWSNDKELLKTTLNTAVGIDSSGIGWYRKHFEIPNAWREKSILINFEGICEQNKIFINGIAIKDPQTTKCAFETPLNPYLNFDGKNVIAIQVMNTKQENGKWSTESGIYKHVWLVIKEPPKSRKKD